MRYPPVEGSWEWHGITSLGWSREERVFKSRTACQRYLRSLRKNGFRLRNIRIRPLKYADED